jgi:predicted transposase/invertase (TIGR01784 family)
VSRRSICILISDHVQIHENEAYHNCYRLYDARTGSEFTDLLEVDTLELPKLPREADGTALWDWLKLLDARKEEELVMLKERNPQVGKAVSRLMALSEDEAARMIAESREKLRRDISAIEHAARKEGREEAQLAFARKLLEHRRPVKEIMEYTGLSEAEILALRAEDNPALH